MDQSPALTIDQKGFLRVDGVKAPFKLNPQTQTIEFIHKDRRGDKPISIPLKALDNVK